MKKLSFLLLFTFLFSFNNAQSEENKQKVSWYDLRRGLFISEQEKKPLLLSFCSSENIFCQKLNGQTFANPEIIQSINDNFIAVNIDFLSQNPIKIDNSLIPEKELVKRFEIKGFPTLIFLDPKGNKISGSVRGFIPPEKLSLILKYISSEVYKNTKFTEFLKKEENLSNKKGR